MNLLKIVITCIIGILSSLILISCVVNEEQRKERGVAIMNEAKQWARSIVGFSANVVCKNEPIHSQCIVRDKKTNTIYKLSCMSGDRDWETTFFSLFLIDNA